MGIMDTVDGLLRPAILRQANGIVCDTDGCKNTFTLSRYDPDADRIRDVARAEASWQYIEGKDVCPSCGSEL